MNPAKIGTVLTDQACNERLHESHFVGLVPGD